MQATASFIYGPAALLLFLVGFGGLILRDNFFQKILAGNIMAGGVFLFLVTIAYGEGSGVDPVPQSMVLTGIVVSVSFTALALALVRRLQENAPLRESAEKSIDEAVQRS